MKIAIETSFVDHSGSSARNGLGREEKTNGSPFAEGGTDELTHVNQMKEPKKEKISELDDKTPVTRVPPPILFINPEKAEQSPKPKKRKVLSEGFSSFPNNNNVLDSSVLESIENTLSEVGNSLHLSSGKDTDCNKFGCEKKKKNAGGRQSSFTQEQLSLLRSNFSVNKYPSREDMMQITKAVGQPYEKVAKWFDNSRVKDKRQQGKGKLPRRLKCPNCDEIISKFNGYHRFTCAGHKDSRKEEHEAEVKNDNVVVEMRQEKVSEGQGDLSKLDNQPEEDVASQSEIDDSYSDLRALLDSDPDSD